MQEHAFRLFLVGFIFFRWVGRVNIFKRILGNLLRRATSIVNDSHLRMEPGLVGLWREQDHTGFLWRNGYIAQDPKNLWSRSMKMFHLNTYSHYHSLFQWMFINLSASENDVNVFHLGADCSLSKVFPFLSSTTKNCLSTDWTLY